MQEENTPNEWLRQRQILAWEPEIVISGAVLWGLLQLPEQVNHFIVYLNDWGPAVFLVSDIDELLAAFMKTSIYLLVAGLIVNLLMRAVWVVMIGMSYAFPAGLFLEKFRFQRYFHDKMAALPSLEKQVIRLDRLCSVIYATTFLLFMCLVGAFFFIFVYGGAFLMLYHYWPNKSREVIEQLNALLNISIVFFALTYFLDFITLGWLKRFKWYAVLYRPIYVFMSLLTLAPLYRNIYYILIGHLNRWRVFAFCLAFVMLASLMVNVQRSRNNFFTDSVFGQRSASLYTHEGYYRDKGASQMNRWMHIASAVVEEDLIEVFIPYKVALEDSMLSSYARKHQISLDSLLQKPALQLKALSDFYRLQLDTLLLPPISYKMFYFEKYRQTGLLGFVDVSDLPRGEHHLQLLLHIGKPEKAANIWFYKKSRPVLPE